MSSKIVPFVLGAVAGAGIALLFAPRTGKETRELIADKAAEACGNAQEAFSQLSENAGQLCHEAVIKGQSFASDAVEAGQRAYTRVREAASGAGPVVVEKTDDLRKKIEEARARIAADVLKNAEESQAAVAELQAEPVVADAAQPAL